MRIVELSAFVAVPLGGATLAAMGADVIRIDPVGGGIDSGRLPRVGGRSLYWAGLNQGKRSVTLDLRSQRGRDLVGRLIASGGDGGGIVITNLGTRGWSSYESMRAFRSDLIMVALSGNPDGSQAVDYTVNARLGFARVTGPAHLSEPVNNVVPGWDAQAGYLVAVAVLAAERHRRRTGEGQLVSFNLMDVGLTLTARLGAMAEAELVPQPRGRYGNFVYGTFGKDFITRDGGLLMVVALTARQWRSLMDATSLHAEMDSLAARLELDLSHEEARWDAREEIAAILGGWILGRDLIDVSRQFDAYGVVWAPYRTFKELVRDDAFASLDNPTLARVYDHGVGEYLLPRSPFNFGAFDRDPVVAPPRLGQHTGEVLREVAGLSDQELSELRSSGLAGEPSP
jgi:2-methylfumaryl-CoA isomerase